MKTPSAVLSRACTVLLAVTILLWTAVELSRTVVPEPVAESGTVAWLGGAALLSPLTLPVLTRMLEALPE